MKKRIASKIGGIIVLVVFLVIVVFPFFWLVVTSLKDPRDISLMPTELWPHRWSLEFYISAFRKHHLGVYLENSLIVAIWVTILTILLALPAAYAFARLRFRGKKFWKNFILIANMFPLIAIVTPAFIILRNLGLINTYIGLIIPSVIFTLPMSIWTLTAFIQTVPIEMEEAARIDGCSRAQAVFRVLIPLSAPGIFTTAIIAFIASWNEFMFALILITRDQMRTIPVAISMFPGEYSVPWGDMAAASVIATIPIIVVVLILQKRIVSGLTSGAVKG